MNVRDFAKAHATLLWMVRSGCVQGVSLKEPLRRSTAFMALIDNSTRELGVGPPEQGDHVMQWAGSSNTQRAKKASGAEGANRKFLELVRRRGDRAGDEAEDELSRSILLALRLDPRAKRTLATA